MNKLFHSRGIQKVQSFFNQPVISSLRFCVTLNGKGALFAIRNTVTHILPLYTVCSVAVAAGAPLLEWYHAGSFEIFVSSTLSKPTFTFSHYSFQKSLL
jgi:hypothetical protein